MGKPPKKKKPKRKPSAYNKHVGREMRAGKTMKQAAASWKKKGSKPKSQASPKKGSKPTGGTRRMGKNTFNTQKIFSLMTKAALLGPAFIIATGSGDMTHKMKEGIHSYTGLNFATRGFDFEYALNTYKPYIFMKIIGAVVPKIGGFIKSLVG